MKRLAPVLVLALVASSALIARAQDDKIKRDGKEPVLPFNPVAGAKEGDWTVFKCTQTQPGTTEKHAQSWSVKKVGDKTVKVQQERAGDESVQEELELPLTEAPTIAKFFQVGDERVVETKVVDEKKTVGNREFACKKLTFQTYNGERMLRATVWLSAEVKGSGVVAIHLEGDLTEPKGAKATVDFELAGFGSKDKTEFGKTKAELVKELAADKPAETPKKDEKGDKK